MTGTMQLNAINDALEHASHVDLRLDSTNPFSDPIPSLCLSSRPVAEFTGNNYIRRVAGNRWRFRNAPHAWPLTTYNDRFIWDIDEVELPAAFRLVHMKRFSYIMRGGGLVIKQALRPVFRYLIWNPDDALPAFDQQDTPTLRTTTEYESIFLWNP